MHRSVWLLTLLALSVIVAIFVNKGEETIHTVAVRTWPADPANDVPLPEIDDSELAVPGIADRPSFGIAFSGGGTRSASASLGQLRALTRLGWVERARYISSNSGGSWIAVPYTYLPRSVDEQRFLGEYLPPAQLGDDNLRHAFVDPLAFSTAIHDAGTIDELLEVGRGDEAYSDVVASIFLEPFGLHDNERFFTFHRGALDRVLAANPSLGEDNFHIVERADRPYLVVVGVMLGQQMSTDPNEYFPLEMTPLYTGIRRRFEFEKDDEIVAVGGGYVESFGYDSYEPGGPAVRGRHVVQLTGSLARGDKPVGDRYRFTLSDVIGASSAAPLATLSRSAVPNLLFPEFRHWAVDRVSTAATGELLRHMSDEFQHGDGADMDNLSVTSLIARKTGNIIAFVNSATAFRKPATGCTDVTDEQITDDVISLFRPNGRLVHNVMFANGEAELMNLCDAFAAKKAAGKPLVHCQDYDVIRNDWYRVEPHRTSVCWVYLDRVESWLNDLDPSAGDLVSDILAGEGSFDSFPHYSTFAEHGVSLIDLNRERVVALSNLAAWTVLESAEDIAAGLAGAALPVPPGD